MPSPKPPPATPPGVPIPYPNLMSAAKSGAPVINSLIDLLGAMRAAMPHGPLASMPSHYKSALHANGIPTPTGPAAVKQQADIVHLEQKLKDGGDDAGIANVDLQNALQKQQQTLQMMSKISKSMHQGAMNVIRNMKG